MERNHELFGVHPWSYHGEKQPQSGQALFRDGGEVRLTPWACQILGRAGRQLALASGIELGRGEYRSLCSFLNRDEDATWAAIAEAHEASKKSLRERRPVSSVKSIEDLEDLSPEAKAKVLKFAQEQFGEAS